MPTYEAGVCYLGNTGKIPNSELCTRYKYKLWGVLLHSDAVGCSSPDGEDGEVDCLPGKVGCGRNYPIPHENQQLLLTTEVTIPSSTWSPAAIVDSIQPYVKNKSTTLKWLHKNQKNIDQNVDFWKEVVPHLGWITVISLDHVKPFEVFFN